MAQIYPFRALRYSAKAGELSSLICPQAGNNRLAPNHAVLLEDGILKQDSAPAIYIYEQEFYSSGQKKSAKGMLCLVALDDGANISSYAEIVPEKSAAEREKLEKTLCQFQPVSALYRDDERASADRLRLLSAGKPRLQFTQDNVTHRLWVINDILAIAALQDDFSKRRLTLAGGQDRFAAALESSRSGGPSCLLAFLAEETQQGLTFVPNHVLIPANFNFSLTHFFGKCEPYFQVVPRDNLQEIGPNLDALYRQGKKAFAVYTGEESWALLILKETSVMKKLLPEKSEAYQNLDISVLQHLILGQLMGIPPADTVPAHSIGQAVCEVKNRNACCAVMANPPRRKEVYDIIAAGELLPAGTAEFSPEPPAGLLMARLSGAKQQ